jgi:hypothetical protein
MSDSEGFAELDAVLKQGEQIQPLIQPAVVFLLNNYPQSHDVHKPVAFLTVHLI